MPELFTGVGIPSIDEVLICPVVSCGCQNVHFDMDGARPDVRYVKDGRLEAVSVFFWCEHGHSWTIVFEFCTGTMKAGVHNVSQHKSGEAPR